MRRDPHCTGRKGSSLPGTLTCSISIRQMIGVSEIPCLLSHCVTPGGTRLRVSHRRLVVHPQVYVRHCLVLCVGLHCQPNNSRWLICLWRSSSDQRPHVPTLSATAPQPREASISMVRSGAGGCNGLPFHCRSSCFHHCNSSFAAWSRRTSAS